MSFFLSDKYYSKVIGRCHHQQTMDVKEVNILTVRISVISFEAAVTSVEELIASGETHYVCFCNVHTVMTGVDDPDFRRITNEASLALPDGMPLVWAARMFGHDQPGRVYGPDMMMALCRKGLYMGYSHFFYGGDTGVLGRLIENLRRLLPGLKVAGYYSPPFRPLTPEEDIQVVDIINNSGAHILWVGLGAPKQERWMAEHRNRINVPVMLGVGAAFDFHSGRIKQAPKWMQNIGLEWLFRLYSDPRRLWKRYLYNNPRFIYHVSKQILTEYLKSHRTGK